MVRTTLKLVAFLLIVMGIATLIPRWTWAAGAGWYGIAKIAVGVVVFAIAYSAKN